MVRGIKKRCISHEEDGMPRKQLGVLAVNMIEDGSCKDMEAKASYMNSEQKLVKLNKT
jgi:hypothetical protein